MKNKLMLLFLVTIAQILKGEGLEVRLVDNFKGQIPLQEDQKKSEKRNIQEEIVGQNVGENNLIKLENHGIRPEDMSSQESFKLFEISFDKKQLMHYGAGAVVIIVVCGITYVLCKNGTLKKVSDYIVENKFEMRVAIGAAGILALIGVCVKRGITLHSSSNWIANFFGYNK